MHYPLSVFSRLLDWEPVIFNDQSVALSDYDAWEEEDNLILQFPMPGFKEGSISVIVKDGVLSIQAEEEKKEEAEEKKTYLVRSVKSNVSRAITLPDGLAEEKAKATYENGLLRIEIPHSEEKKPKKLQIEYKE